MHIAMRGFLMGSCAALCVVAAASDVSGAAIVGTKTDDLNHSDTNSAFFTLSTDGTTTLLPDNGWAPSAAAPAGTINSVTTKKSFSVVGSSTAAGNWTDGNRVPTGITLTFDALFTISALPSNQFLTVPGATGTTLGRGIGITFQNVPPGNDDMDLAEGIAVSPVTVSNVVYSGSLADPNFTFTPGDVSNFGTRVFRSNNFAEGTAGMLLTQGTNTIGFGTATGTIASNQLIENNFGTTSSVFTRQTGPYTLEVTQGVSVIKGIGLTYDVTYDVSPVPEPSTALLALGGIVITAVARRRPR